MTGTDIEIIDFETTGNQDSFSLAASAHARIPQGGRPDRPTLIQVRAARTPDGHTSADTRVLNDDFSWTTILSLTGDLVAVPTDGDPEEFTRILTGYGHELLERTIRIISL